MFVRASCRLIVSVVISYSQEYHYHTDIPLLLAYLFPVTHISNM